MRGIVFFVEADAGQYIKDFIDELIEIRKNNTLDVVGAFGNIIFKVEKDTTADDLHNIFNSL